ncbi:S8 family serine peptidase [uncultured Draconibacterium sp.]|uniref:S8 family serine peptidase n=1 Tax=uncultured Draconibacterium sp. TaxID=1573823 RepID=UPI0025EE23BD|nr:S8 family serine peptidase [uncultured Draconibacterium sp.]
MKYLIIFAIIGFWGLQQLNAQNYYWIGFTDKNNSSYSLDHPEAYLSERAIQRRIRQNIQLDSLDLPVNKTYIDSVLSLDVTFVHASKWLNGITVKTDSANLGQQLESWAFISEVHLTKPGTITKQAYNKFNDETIVDAPPIDSAKYGGSVHQVAMLEGQFLHDLDYTGQGIHIAVLDGGFKNANSLPAFDSLWANNQILGVKDFVNPDADFYQTNSHGMSVLSCMGANVPGTLIGTAPGASYWLLRSEDTSSEYIIEEDNWVAAAEFADSVGADIINSSLGYTTFYDAISNHTYADMDGSTTRVTRGANIAASRGMLVFSSAGNERDDPWFRIVAPSDGTEVIGVGAVDKNLNPAYFTSAGPAANGDLKPNVSAMGYQTTLQRSDGSFGLGNGTSFSSPVLAGMAASLWQRYPNKTAAEIKDAIERSGHLYFSPDSLQGYGVPNMRSASAILDPIAVQTNKEQRNWKIFPNPFQNKIVLKRARALNEQEILISLYSMDGVMVKTWQRFGASSIVLDNLHDLQLGIYLLAVQTKAGVETFKINKVQ